MARSISMASRATTDMAGTIKADLVEMDMADMATEITLEMDQADTALQAVEMEDHQEAMVEIKRSRGRHRPHRQRARSWRWHAIFVVAVNSSKLIRSHDSVGMEQS